MPSANHHDVERATVATQPRSSYDLGIITLVYGEQAEAPGDIHRPFRREPDFGAASVNYALAELLACSEEPR